MYETYREALDVEIVDSGQLQENSSVEVTTPEDQRPVNAGITGTIYMILLILRMAYNAHRQARI